MEISKIFAKFRYLNLVFFIFILLCFYHLFMVFGNKLLWKVLIALILYSLYILFYQRFKYITKQIELNLLNKYIILYINNSNLNSLSEFIYFMVYIFIF